MAHRRTTRSGQRLRLVVGVGALVAMATLPFFLGTSKSDMGSSTTVIAAPTTNRTGARAVPNQTAAPFNGGWAGGGPFTGGWGNGLQWWQVVSNQAQGWQ